MTMVGSKQRTEQARAGFACLALARLTEQVTRAGQAVLSHLAEHRWPSGLFLAQFHLHFIGFLLLVYFPRDEVIHSKTLVT